MGRPRSERSLGRRHLVNATVPALTAGTVGCRRRPRPAQDDSARGRPPAVGLAVGDAADQQECHAHPDERRVVRASGGQRVGARRRGGPGTAVVEAPAVGGTPPAVVVVAAGAVVGVPGGAVVVGAAVAVVGAAAAVVVGRRRRGGRPRSGSRRPCKVLGGPSITPPTPWGPFGPSPSRRQGGRVPPGPVVGARGEVGDVSRAQR